MIKLLTILSSFFAFFCLNNSYQSQENEINITAKVEKIDFTENSFLIYIKNKTGKGVFSIPKGCSYEKSIYIYKLQIGRTYSFKLKKSLSVYMPEHHPKEVIHTELVDGKIIWTSNMKRVFYEDCLNMCGLYIDNEVKIKK